MPEYVYRCRGGFRFLLRHGMEDAGKTQTCPCGLPAERIWTPPVIVMRPKNYSASPTDPAYWEGIHEDPEYLPCQIAPAGDVPDLLSASEVARRCAVAAASSPSEEQREAEE